MKEVLDDIERWRAEGRRVAIARVVGVDGSGPRDPGATMVVNDAGEVAGSVSGGCVEGAVVTEALAVLAGDTPARHRDASATRTTRRSRSGSRAAGPSISSWSPSTGEHRRTGSTVRTRRSSTRSRETLARRTPRPRSPRSSTGPGVGAKLLVRPGPPDARHRSATPISTGSSRATRRPSSTPG